MAAPASTNLVKISMIPETVYGITPATGNFIRPGFTSESLDGNVNTVESALIRTDRNSSGQIVTNIDVGGSLDSEMQDSEALKVMIESAMLNDFSTETEHTVDIDLDVSANTLTRATGSFVTDGVKEGDFVKLSGYTNTNNNVSVLVTGVAATVLNIIPQTGSHAQADSPNKMVTESGSASTKYQVLPNAGIGSTLKSFSIEKQFTDLTNKGINYRGMLVNMLNFNVNYGEIITYTADFVGKEYRTYDAASDAITHSRTVGDQPATEIYNGSVDIHIMAAKVFTSWSSSDINIEKMSISINNNFNPQNVISYLSALAYTPGFAQIEVTFDAYIDDTIWPILSKKLNQDPISIAFKVQNDDAEYGFYLPACQVTFPDPQSTGQNENVMISMTGVAKIGESGESALTVYRIT